MIDINRLHNVREGKLQGRGVGKTFAMLVEALGYADFAGEFVEIVCFNWAACDRQLEELRRIALEELGFKWTRRPGRSQIVIGSRRYIFHPPHVPLLWDDMKHQNPHPIFVDKFER